MKIPHWLTLVSSATIGITLVLSGCEGGGDDGSYNTDTGHSTAEKDYHNTDTGNSSTNDTTPPPTDTVITNTPPSTNTVITVLNDDPNCELVLKYRNRDIANEGQVHYVNRVLTSDPFDSANPVCVQYNDTQTGEVTVWKDQRSTGRRIDTLPGDRGIDKVVVWYE